MNITETKHDKGVVFKVEGRLDSTSAPEVEKKVCESIDNGVKYIILNFSALEYISSAGIRVLVHAHKKIQHQKGKIVLSSLPKPVENVLYITGFLPYFKIFDNDELALENLNN